MARRPDIPFSEIASQALSSAESLLFLWIGGKRSSHEWQADRRSQGGMGDSLTVNLNTGAWMHGAADADGGDLISLYAYVNGLNNAQAAVEVADQIGFKLPDGCRPTDKPESERQKPVIDQSAVTPKKAKLESLWEPEIPAPHDAGEEPLAHYARGPRQEFWTYYMPDGIGIIGHIYRYATSDGGKETLPCVYCRHKRTGKGEWRWLSFPQPRPLYGLDRLAAKPNAYVLLVEGEKCADAALELLPNAAIVTWPGGSKAVDKVDLTPLIGRNVYAWPDCDSKRVVLTRAQKEEGVDPETQPFMDEKNQPGVKAMLRIGEKLRELNPDQDFKLVDIPLPGIKPDGWDIADAVAEGMNSAALLNYILKTRPAISLVESNVVDISKKTKAQKKSNSADAEGEEQDDTPKWKKCLLRKNGGEVVACLANVVDILENDERWKGVIVYDEFGQRVVKQKRPPYWNDIGSTGEWDAQDDARTAMWITRLYRFSPSPGMVAEAVEVLARINTVNPPKDWLKSLEWDGIKRLDKWMLDFMGVPVTKYSQRVARWFFMGMVKRVFEPGCKFDYCLVLEGSQGRKKSTALAAIGGEWYGDTDLDLHNKDSMSALRGKMLYEFSELGSVAKAEATKQKSFLSRQVDEYRPVYGRREIRAPRQLIFSGTTNEWEWNKDPTGGRRFWPVMVNQEIDVPGLIEVRDQLFAEAMYLVNNDNRYWPTSQEQAEIFDPEQLSRSIHDSYIDALYEHVSLQQVEFTLFYAANDWLKIPPQNQTRDIQTRIGNALRHLGCKRIERRSDKQSRFWYEPPENQQPTNINANSQGSDDDFIPF